MTAEFSRPDWLVQMEGILETLNEGVMIVDDCSQVIFVNECMESLSGLTRRQVLGRTAAQFYQGQDLEFLNAQIACSHREGSNRCEFHLPHRDGTQVPAVISSRVIEDPEGRPYAVITFTDITEQKRAEQQLLEANRKLRQRQEEIERELQLASRVQQSLTPRALTWGPFTVETFYQPVQTIGGDFGLVAPLGEDLLNLVVCDVTGHGISAALVANRIYSELNALLERRAEPKEMLRRLNDFVRQHIRLSNFYFSMAMAQLRGNRRLTFTGAGHPPALWVSPEGACRRLESQSTVLGLLPGEVAVAAQAATDVELAPGDRVILYTDGFIEVFNERDDLLGIEGLEEIVRGATRLSLPEMKEAILTGVKAWGRGPSSDDMSLVLVESA